MKVHLETGTLLVDNDSEITDLTGFASRNNAKRGFLFLSKVLGKHFPSCPTKMLEVYDELANRIRPNLKKGPTVVIGFSETATCLGYGVYTSLGLADSYYQHSTRHQLDSELLFSFKENHSHATSHFIYIPEKLQHQRLLKNAVNIVLVDDEYTTGNTLLNIIAAFKEKNIHPTFIATSILNWTENKQNNLPKIISLVNGTFSFSIQKEIDTPTYKSETSLDHPNKNLSNSYGRVGCEKIAIDFSEKIEILPKKNDRVLVLGTGEFMNVSYLLATFLKAHTQNVLLQSTTRSPILLGNDVNSILMFKDNYGEKIDNFLYNVIDKHYDFIYICYETLELPIEHDLIKQLKSITPNVYPIYFN
jgi:hypothetical protein